MGHVQMNCPQKKPAKQPAQSVLRQPQQEQQQQRQQLNQQHPPRRVQPVFEDCDGEMPAGGNDDEPAPPGCGGGGSVRSVRVAANGNTSDDVPFFRFPTQVVTTGNKRQKN